MTEASSSTAASAVPASATVMTLPLNDGTEFPITQALVDECRKLYPAIDVLQEVRNMRGWCLGNKNNRKTSSGVLRFVHGWLKDEQNKAPVTAARERYEANVGTQRTPDAERVRVPSIPLPVDLDEQAGRKAWDAVRDALKPPAINQHSFQTWIVPLRGAGVSNGVLYVKVPTAEFMYVGERYGDEINNNAERLGLRRVLFYTEV